MLKKNCPTEIVPGVTDVFRDVFDRFEQEDYARAVFLGIVGKIGVLRHTPYGIVVADDDRSDFVTVIPSRGSHSVLLIQPNADATCNWDTEWKECLRITDELQGIGWQSLLLVYNGGKVTENELNAWALLGREQPGKWPVLIVNGSGRTADKYANDKEFLSKSPSVSVCENNLNSMREKLEQLGAIIDQSAPIITRGTTWTPETPIPSSSESRSTVISS